VKKILLLTTISQFALIAGGSANAQNIPGRAPRAALAPVYSWTGCYVGAHVGYGWGRAEINESNVSVGPGGSANLTSTLESDGAIYGGQIGCNYQFEGGGFANKWVVGIQGDFAGTSIRGSVGDPLNDYLATVPAATGTLGMKTNWLASITGRLGATAWNNRALFYVKGGVAWAQNEWDVSASGYCAFYVNPYGGCINSALRDRRTGGTAGAGIEWVIWPTAPSWTALVEYNYYRFNGSGPERLVGVTFTLPGNAITPRNFDIQIIKVGVNYKLYAP
jgi:outer membrane immunogenic protein